MQQYYNPKVDDSVVTLTPEELASKLNSNAPTTQKILENSGFSGFPAAAPAPAPAPSSVGNFIGGMSAEEWYKTHPNTSANTPAYTAGSQPSTAPGASSPVSDFESFMRGQNGGKSPQEDYNLSVIGIQDSQDQILNQRRSEIKAAAEDLRLATQNAGKIREQGYKAGLGISEGLNWSSAGQDQLYNISKETINDLSTINLKEQQALSNAEANGLEATRKALASLREQRALHEKNLWDIFNGITDNTLARQQEERLSKGQELTTENSKRDDARAVLQNLLNTFPGANFAELPQQVQQQFGELEKEAGYPQGFVAQGLQSLKELKLRQDALIAQNKLDEQKARDEMNAYIKFALGAPRGVTVNIPGLGAVTGVDVPSGEGNNAPSQKLFSQEQLFDKKTGNVVGFKNTYQDGSIKLVDLQGSPIKQTLDTKQIDLQKTGTEKIYSAASSISALRSSFNLSP